MLGKIFPAKEIHLMGGAKEAKVGSQPQFAIGTEVIFSLDALNKEASLRIPTVDRDVFTVKDLLQDTVFLEMIYSEGLFRVVSINQTVAADNPFLQIERNDGVTHVPDAIVYKDPFVYTLVAMLPPGDHDLVKPDPKQKIYSGVSGELLRIKKKKRKSPTSQTKSDRYML